MGRITALIGAVMTTVEKLIPCLWLLTGVIGYPTLDHGNDGGRNGLSSTPHMRSRA